MQNNDRILLSSFLGFIVGFAVCYCLDIPDSVRNSSSLTDLLPPAAMQVTTNANAEPDLFSQVKIEPYPPEPATEWRVTIWYPTIPPQKAGTFDPCEYAARKMGLTD